jgi:hypothetical protein
MQKAMGLRMLQALPTDYLKAGKVFFRLSKYEMQTRVRSVI